MLKILRGITKLARKVLEKTMVELSWMVMRGRAKAALLEFKILSRKKTQGRKDMISDCEI